VNRQTAESEAVNERRGATGRQAGEQAGGGEAFHTSAGPARGEKFIRNALVLGLDLFNSRLLNG